MPHRTSLPEDKKRLHDLREKNPSTHQDRSNCALYGTWMYSLPILDIGTELSFYGNSFMISKSNIDIVNIRLFILSHVLVPPKHSVDLFHFVVLSIFNSIT